MRLLTMEEGNLEKNIGKSIIKYITIGIVISNSFSGYFTCQQLNKGWNKEHIEREVENRCYNKLGLMGSICYKGTSMGRNLIYSIKD